ncbi:DUF4351 domain-containing protein, partial [Crocosphaera sp. XPORK-15E]
MQARFYQEAFTEGEANLLLRQLNRRLGGIPTSLIEQIRGLSIEQIENL